jgi:hypothetical protein
VDSRAAYVCRFIAEELRFEMEDLARLAESDDMPRLAPKGFRSGRIKCEVERMLVGDIKLEMAATR